MAKIFRKTLYVDKSKLYSSDFVSVEKKISFGSKKTTSEWSLILLWGLIQFYMNPLPEYMQNGSSDLITCAWANQRFHSYQNILYTLISSLHIKKKQNLFPFHGIHLFWPCLLSDFETMVTFLVILARKHLIISLKLVIYFPMIQRQW